MRFGDGRPGRETGVEIRRMTPVQENDEYGGAVDAGDLSKEKSTARPVGPAVDFDSISGTSSRSILVGADDLAAVACREQPDRRR